MATVRPFSIVVPDEVLADLDGRLRRTRWPQSLEGVGWSWGTDPGYLADLVRYWVDGYDWRATERRLNGLEQVLVEVDDLDVHLVRSRPATTGATPILLLHGWPGSFLQMLDLAAMLAHPVEGTEPLDVVTASLPGFGFSSPATRPGMGETAMAEVLHRAIAALGFDRYVVHGTDFGAGIASQLVARHPEAVIAAHVGGTSPRADGISEQDSPELQRYARDVARWREEEVGYGAIQSTRPQSLAVALNDSPVGLAAWLVEKYRRWGDCEGDVERRFSKEFLITTVMLYWVTGSIGSSIRLYRDADDDPDLRGTAVPIAHLMSDRDMLRTPREWVARTNRIDRWTQVDRGGHFIEAEEPTLVADDIRAFLADLPLRSRGAG